MTKLDVEKSILDKAPAGSSSGTTSEKTNSKRVRRSYQQLDRSFTCEHIRLKHVSPTPPLAMLGRNPFLLPKSDRISKEADESGPQDKGSRPDRTPEQEVFSNDYEQAFRSDKDVAVHHESRFKVYTDHKRGLVLNNCEYPGYTMPVDQLLERRSLPRTRAGDYCKGSADPEENPLWTKIKHTIDRQQETGPIGYPGDRDYHTRDHPYYDEYYHHNRRYHEGQDRPYDHAYRLQYGRRERYARSVHRWPQPIHLTEKICAPTGKRPVPRYMGEPDGYRMANSYPNGRRTPPNVYGYDLPYSPPHTPHGPYAQFPAPPGAFRAYTERMGPLYRTATPAMLQRSASNPITRRLRKTPMVDLKESKPHIRRKSSDTAQSGKIKRENLLQKTMSADSSDSQDTILTILETCGDGEDDLKHFLEKSCSASTATDGVAFEQTISTPQCMDDVALGQSASMNPEDEDNSVDYLMKEITHLSPDAAEGWNLDQVDILGFSLPDLELLESICEIPNIQNAVKVPPQCSELTA